MGLSPNRGTQNVPQNSIILSLGTPKWQVRVFQGAEGAIALTPHSDAKLWSLHDCPQAPFHWHTEVRCEEGGSSQVGCGVICILHSSARAAVAKSEPSYHRAAHGEPSTSEIV